jgi:sugar/nucleoside kinase (ribokinase family)
VLATLGDLVEDIVVRLDGPIQHATDTPSSITRRRGGSAANVAAAAADGGYRTRFLGQVGDDATGRSLIGDLSGAGVDTDRVRVGGTTGAIIVLVEPDGERTMLTDRGASVLLDRPDPSWLTGVSTMHLPLYSFVGRPIAQSARTIVSWAHAQGVLVSIDLSSVSLIESLGVAALDDLVRDVAPTIVFANEDESDAVDLSRWCDDALVVVKHGARPARVNRPGEEPVEVPVATLDTVSDTTGAGDAFAAGFLTTDGWERDPVAACAEGHRSAATLIANH